ncbi:MAG TPA: hypothetical protein VIU81_06225 [Gaiellaceae bacterium]
MTIEQLTVTIRGLIAERQALRDRGASRDELERNRLEIVHRQQELSHMWIESHRPEALPRAA